MKKTKAQKPLFKKSPLYVVMMMALATPFAAQAQGTDYTWTNALGDNDIHNIENWVGAPNGTQYDEKYTINTDGAHTPIWKTGYWEGTINPYTLNIGDGADNSGKLVITKDYNPESNDSYTHFSGMKIGVNGGSGLVEITDNPDLPEYMQHVASFNDKMYLGSGQGSIGVINLIGTGAKESVQQNMRATLELGYADPTNPHAIGEDGGHGIINIDGASLNASMTQMIIGSGTGSVGEINVLAGGKFGQGAMTQPIWEDDGVGNQIFQKTSIFIGHNGGTGKLNISGRSASGDISRAYLNTGLIVGHGDNAQGEVNIANGAELVTTVGHGEYDPVERPDGVSTVVGSDGGHGSVSIDGDGSAWFVSGKGSIGSASSSPWDPEDPNTPEAKKEIGNLYVGQEGGTGDVTLSNGGTLNIGRAVFEQYNDPEDGSSYYNYFDRDNFVDGIGSLHLATDATSKGSLNIGAGEGKAAQATGTLLAKDVQFGDGDGALVFNHTDNTGDYEFIPELISVNDGNGTIKQIAGVTTLNVDNSQFTGLTNITGGTLVANNRLGGTVDISNAGTLAGIGSVGATTVKSGGRVAPGSSAGADMGTLTVDEITFLNGSTLQVQVNPDGQTDLLQATTANGGSGNVDIQGGQVAIQGGAGTWAQDTKYTIIQADGTVTGQFDSVTSNLAFLSAALEEDTENVYLYLTTKRNDVGFGDVGGTFNEINTGIGIEGLTPGNPVYDSIISMSAGQARNSYNNLSGEIHAGLKGALINNSRHARSAVNQHLQGLDANTPEAHKNLWVSTWAHDGYLKDDGNAAKLNNKGYGVLVGADVYDQDTTTVGLALGYERSELDNGGVRSSEAEVDAVHFMTYGRTTAGPIDLKGGIGYSWLDVDTTRNITVPGLAGQSKANYNGGVVQIFAEGSHTFDLTPKADITPYAGLAYQHIKTNGFNEKGSYASLHGSSESDDVIISTIGVRESYHFNENNFAFLDLGWQHNFSDNAPQARMNFVGGKGFNVKGNKLTQDSALIGIGAQFGITKNSTLRAGYEGEFGHKSRDHGAKIVWNLKF